MDVEEYHGGADDGNGYYPDDREYEHELLAS